MKYLSDYTAQPLEQALDKAGAFFAFSQHQFDEAKKPNVTYVNMKYGLICPKDNALALAKEISDITTKAIAQDLEENGKHNVILRELNNHEAFYTRDIQSTLEALEDYPTITKDDVMQVFKNETNPAYEPVIA
jgi:hypothetical protein